MLDSINAGIPFILMQAEIIVNEIASGFQSMHFPVHVGARYLQVLLCEQGSAA